jgi:DNA-binding MarR family transcriptional regulator
MDEQDTGAYFAFFTEIGIIDQISRAFLEARLPEGLTMPHFAVLNHLTRLGGGQTPLALARAFQVPKTTMTHTLAVLEKRGLIEMQANPGDRRSKLVGLTQAGSALRKKALAELEPVMVGVSGEIPVEKIRDVLPVITEIREAIDRLRDRPV